MGGLRSTEIRGKIMRPRRFYERFDFMKRIITLALLSIAIMGSLQAQVRKCTGLDGKVTYSDFVCSGDTAKETGVKTDVNTIDASGFRQDSQRDKTDHLMQQGASKCKFSYYAIGDTKGKDLATAAEQECLSNIAAKASGQAISLEAYNFWKDHHQIKSTQRSANARSMNCVPNGFGGMRCN